MYDVCLLLPHFKQRVCWHKVGATPFQSIGQQYAFETCKTHTHILEAPSMSNVWYLFPLVSWLALCLLAAKSICPSGIFRRLGVRVAVTAENHSQGSLFYCGLSMLAPELLLRDTVCLTDSTTWQNRLLCAACRRTRIIIIIIIIIIISRLI